MAIRLLLTLLLAMTCQVALAAPASVNKAKKQWCANVGQVRVLLPTGLKADCVTDTYAVAIAPAPQWADAVGRALNYAAQTGKRPGIVLIQRDSGERRDVGEAMLTRLRWKLPFVIWTMDTQGHESGPE